MRILQINNYNNLRGGSEKVFHVSIELLKKEGHDVRYFSVASSEAFSLCDGVEVEVKPWSQRFGILDKLKGVCNFIYNKNVANELEELIKQFDPQIVHLHIFYGALSNAVIDILRKYHIPMVQSVHEFRLVCPAYTCLDPKHNICVECATAKYKFSCIKKRCIKSSAPLSLIAACECFIRDKYFNYQKNISAFIMVSKFIEEIHLQYYPDIKDKSFQMYNSINIEDYSRFVSNSMNEDKYFLYFGRLSYEKGLNTLIDVFLDNPHLKLRIAGTGPIENKLKERVNGENASNIEFLGFVSGDNLRSLIAEAYFTVVPSEWYENNPLSIIESFALGTPVIASRIGGIPELISNGSSGYLHDPKSKESLLKVLQDAISLDSSQYRILSLNCLDFAKNNFDNAMYYNKLIRLYDEIINHQNDTYKKKIRI